jgi:hypothetical protein
MLFIHARSCKYSLVFVALHVADALVRIAYPGYFFLLLS